MNFAQFFTTATQTPSPYAWQSRLACGENPTDHAATPATGTLCQSRLINIPTGLGKTAGVVLAWLWNRLGQPDEAARQTWPRRLVYCLPMRTLVEQTEAEVRCWIDRLAQHYPETVGQQRPRVVVLMGGEAPQGRDQEWDLYPEEPAILIGTQDMLLSRALNRGYGMSRYRWPIHFALLNNDALWILDEVQLMGSGLASTTQLEGFRAQPSLGAKRCYSWWMSATIRPDWLKTVDLLPESLSELERDSVRLTDRERNDGARTQALLTASKMLRRAAVDSGSKSLREVANFLKKHHSPHGLNLVVVNTVKRARELHAELAKMLKNALAQPLLLHSQFRPEDRLRVFAAIKEAAPGQIVISTQVIEAGVDLSAHTLFTEVAPWSSLVQRFGRCNRWLVNGQQHYPDAQIFWFDLPEEKDHLPYPSASLEAARVRLAGLSNAGLQHLEKIASPDEDRPQYRHVIRRKDLVDLFDTTPDLAGADLDIDRYIRDADESHVRVFWRTWEGNKPNGTDLDAPQPQPRREELCSTGVGDFKSFLGKQGTAWRWSPLDGEWQSVKADNVTPGQTYLLHVEQGGYDPGSGDYLPLGWTGNPKSLVTPIPALLDRDSTIEPHGFDGDPDSATACWQTVAEHTDEVCRALDEILAALVNDLTEPPGLPEVLRHAARWHDWGKAHPAFQAKLIPEQVVAAAKKDPIAKAPAKAWLKGRLPRKPEATDRRRPHFRHELASALAVLLPDAGFPEKDIQARDLVAYLVAAHHGKVRLSIRSLPGEAIPPRPTSSTTETRFARGVWDGDQLPSVDLGGGTSAGGVTLSLEPMELGLGEAAPFLNQPSWAERCLDLRDALGPFRLAYLETLLRAADGRGSQL